MADLVRDTANSTTNPRVLFAWQSQRVGDSPASPARSEKGGFFQPLSSMSFRVLRPDGTELVAATVVDPTDEANQLDPESEGGKGRIIVPPFTVAAGEPTGLYTLEVTFVVDPVDGAPLPSKTVSYTFRVVDEAHPFVEDAYAQITDMIAAGFPVGSPAPTGGFTFTQAAAALQRATLTVERITRRRFVPFYALHEHNGKGGPVLQVDHAIVGLTDVAFTFTTFTPADLPVQEGDVRVFNRHIRQNLQRPDDRQDPRIEFLRTPNQRYPREQVLGDVDLLSSSMGFVDSQQNVKMLGVWGYTDFDGSPFGKTPDLIREATLRLAARYIAPLWSQVGGAGSNVGFAGPVLSERTLDQSVTFANLASSDLGAGAYAGAFTGDPEVDQILAVYMAPPKFGSA